MHESGKIEGATVEMVADGLRLDTAVHNEGGQLKTKTRRELNAAIKKLGHRRKDTTHDRERKRLYTLKAPRIGHQKPLIRSKGRFPQIGPAQIKYP